MKSIKSILINKERKSGATARDTLVSFHPEPNIIYTLPKLQATVLISILAENIHKLSILGTMVPTRPVRINLRYRTLEEKYGAINNFELKGCDKETKFQMDRTFVEDILTVTLKELKASESFNSLVRILDDYERQINEEDELLEDTREKDAKLNELSFLLENERKSTLRSILEHSEHIHSLKNMNENQIITNEVKLGYLRKWENSRMEQNHLIAKGKEDKYINTTEHHSTEINREMRINEEITSYLNETQQDYENDIEKWMETYDTEIEKKDNEIIVLKGKIEIQSEEHAKLRELFEQHKQEIEEFLEYKEQKRLEAEWLQKRTNAAIKIQAWWRGVMVRKKLGPYRKKKKGKDKDKKKKKK